MPNSKHDNQELIALLEVWINIEKSTIKATAELLGKIEDPLLKSIVSDVRGDSRKHRELLEIIMSIEKQEESYLNEQGKKYLKSFIDTHALLEENAVEMAEQTLEQASHPLSKMLLEYILHDEKKHDMIISSMEKYLLNNS